MAQDTADAQDTALSIGNDCEWVVRRKKLCQLSATKKSIDLEKGGEALFSLRELDQKPLK